MKELINTLEKCGYTVKEFNDSKEAKMEILKEIGLSDSIGIGGSMTILGMGLYEAFKERGNEVYWHWKATNREVELEKAKSAKVYITSTNALTRDGKLVNMDGAGNRVTSMICGHDDVFVVVGRNKICNDYNAAVERIKNVASPKNAIRLNKNTPCTYTGKCSDCNSVDRICNVETIIHRNPVDTRIHIYLVNEDLGY